MALVVKDRVRVSSVTTGTGPLTLGVAITGFQDFSVIGNGNQTYYTIVDPTTGDWEVGIGTYSSTGPSLDRNTILESSTGGTAVNFAANPKDVFVTYPAERSVYVEGTAIVPAETARLGFANLTQGSALSVLGVTGNATANVASIAAASDHQVFRRSGTGVSFGAVALNQANAVTGTLPIGNGGTGNTTGNAATATVWQTARTLTIGSTGKSVDGSANVSWNLSEIGVNNSTLTLATSGIATGSQTWTSNQGTNATFTVNVPATNLGITAGTTAGPIVTSSTGTNATLPTASATASGVVTTGAQTWAGVKTFNSTITGSISGNAGTATTATNVTVTTSSTSSAFKVPFANTTVSTTGSYGLLQDSAAEFTYNPSTNTLVVGTFSGALSGNATTATTLATTRTLWGQNFNGGANVTGNLTSVGNITGTAGVTLTATSGTLALAATGANIITATTNGSERVRVTSAGDVGVNNTNPGERLDVTGSIRGTQVISGNGIFVNSIVITANYTIPTGSNAMSAGPIEVDDGVTVTVSDGSVWTIV